eukprot:scaffold52761_cov21-Tisochrysis_lutea.AAC.3
MHSRPTRTHAEPCHGEAPGQLDAVVPAPLPPVQGLGREWGAQGHVAQRPSHPRDLHRSPSTGGVQGQGLAIGPQHTVHQSHQVSASQGLYLDRWLQGQGLVIGPQHPVTKYVLHRECVGTGCMKEIVLCWAAPTSEITVEVRLEQLRNSACKQRSLKSVIKGARAFIPMPQSACLPADASLHKSLPPEQQSRSRPKRQGSHCTKAAYTDTSLPCTKCECNQVPMSAIAERCQQCCCCNPSLISRKTHTHTHTHRYTEASQVPEKPKYGCYVSGLYLEGAGWDHVHSHLTRQDPKVLVTELPILQIVPIEANKLKLANTFRAPVYVTQVRRKPGVMDEVGFEPQAN